MWREHNIFMVVFSHLGARDEFLEIERRQVANGGLVGAAVSAQGEKLSHLP